MQIDHWHWCVAGLRGIVVMLNRLAAGNVPPTDKAIAELKEHVAALQKLIAAVEEPLH